jgi:hypothetical protein
MNEMRRHSAERGRFRRQHKLTIGSLQILGPRFQNVVRRREPPKRPTQHKHDYHRACEPRDPRLQSEPSIKGGELGSKFIADNPELGDTRERGPFAPP